LTDYNNFWHATSRSSWTQIKEFSLTHFNAIGTLSCKMWKS